MPYLCTTMRKKLLFAILGMMAIISCNSKGQTRPADSKDSVAVDTIAPETSDDLRKDSLKTDTLSYSKEEGKYSFNLLADYPVEGDDTLVKVVRRYINDFLGGAYDGSLDDGKAMIKKNGEIMYGNFVEMCGDADLEDVSELYYYKSVERGYETNAFITFMTSGGHYTGGLHGIGFETGVTFSKSNGKTFGYDMMKGTDSPEFKRFIKEGLRKYFSTEGQEPISDDDLLQELVSYSGSIDELPLPDSEPYLTEKGVKFVYQPYEISYYAAGKPEFTIPYAAIRPYLTSEAVKLFLNNR